MNELPSYLGLGGGDVESGSESGLLNFIVHSQKVTSFGRRCYLFTSQCSLFCMFFDTVLVLFCVIINL
jgi:hypothetical protein